MPIPLSLSPRRTANNPNGQEWEIYAIMAAETATDAQVMPCQPVVRALSFTG